MLPCRRLPNLIYFHLTEWSDKDDRRKLDAKLMEWAVAFSPELEDPDAPPWWWDDSGNDQAFAAMTSMQGRR